MYSGRSLSAKVWQSWRWYSQRSRTTLRDWTLTDWKVILRPSWSILSSSYSGSFCFKCMKAFFLKTVYFSNVHLVSCLGKKLSDRKCGSVSPCVFRNSFSIIYLWWILFKSLPVLSVQVSPPQYSAPENLSHFGCPCTLSSISLIWGSVTFQWLHLQVLHRPNSLKPASWNSNRDEVSLSAN